MKANSMTEAEADAWGDAEVAARLLDLNYRTPDGLEQAQKNADMRRRSAGLSRIKASALVIEATRRKRFAAYREESK